MVVIDASKGRCINGQVLKGASNTMYGQTASSAFGHGGTRGAIASQPSDQLDEIIDKMGKASSKA